MARLILTRFGLAFVSLVAVSIIIFWCIEWLPGDAASRTLGRDATAESLAVLRVKLHLELPAWQRYLQWLFGMLHGDLGMSLVADRPALGYVWGRAINTLILTAVVLAIYVPLSIGLGLWTAVYRGRAVDHAVSILIIFGMCVPEYVVGIALTMIFALLLPWFPPLALIDQAHGFFEVIHMLFLPAITLAAAMTAYAVRLMRESLIDVLESGYVQMARLKGLPSWRILWFHALPNALGPALNVTALNIAWLMGGIVVVESVFNFPGLGRLLVESISLKDYPVIQAAALLLAGVYILCNFAADIVSILLNPRLRAQFR